MKILVVGGSGLIGSHVMKAAGVSGHTVIGTYRQHAQPGLVHLNCADVVAVRLLLETQKPEAVIYAGGMSWVDGCEDDPSRAFSENVAQPTQLAEWCHTAGARFAYFSSNYVFDGKAGPYAESDATNPKNVYGRSKLQAEQDIQRVSHGQALLLRVTCVYGTEPLGKNFACQVWHAMKEGNTLNLPLDQCGNPTCAGDIARWLVQLLQNHESGLWHLAGPSPDCTRPQWAEKLVHAFEAAGVRRHPKFSITTLSTAELNQRAMRPLRAGLLTPKADALKLASTAFDQTIREMVYSIDAYGGVRG